MSLHPFLPPVHGRGAPGAQLLPEPGVPAAAQQGLSQLAAAAAGASRLGPVAHDGAHRLLRRHPGIPAAPDHRPNLRGESIEK